MVALNMDSPLYKMIAIIQPEKRSRLWQQFARAHYSSRFVLLCVLVAPLIPALSWYIGLTQIGWRAAGTEPIVVALKSGFILSVCIYLCIAAVIVTVGCAINWMTQTYKATATLKQCIMFSFVVAMPFLVLSISGLYPVFWFDVFLLLLAILGSVILLYEGMPIFMGIPNERAFLFSSAVVVAGIIGFMVSVVAVILVWDQGFVPVFLDVF